MRSLTPTITPASGPRRSQFVGWSLTLMVIPLSVIFLVGVAATVADEWGVAGVVMGLALFPVTLVVVPIQAGFVHGNWLLAGLLAGLIAAGWLSRVLMSPPARS
jgi:hypothetical protein